MYRPYLVNFSGIISQNQLSVRAAVSQSSVQLRKDRTPLDSMNLFKKDRFRLRLVAFSPDNEVIFSKDYDTDNYGKIELILPKEINSKSLSNLTLYEVGLIDGLEIHLGSILPVIINSPSKIVISDFDKTLVDTKYSTPKEMYYSLNRPLSHFPRVEKSIDLINNFSDKNFQTFILSASPHFYEHAISDWLYQNNIIVSNLFLKDYRDFISIFDGPLSPKDIKKQGFYKLNQLIDILLMTGAPRELILMGDGFESDPYIYITLKRLCQRESDPWKVWQSLKNHTIFKLTTKQDSFFITKFYQLSELAKRQDTDIKIYIRATEDNIEKLKTYNFGSIAMNELNSKVIYYVNK